MAERLEQLKNRRTVNPVLAGPAIRPNTEGLQPVSMDWSRPTPHVYALWSPTEKQPNIKNGFRQRT